MVTAYQMVVLCIFPYDTACNKSYILNLSTDSKYRRLLNDIGIPSGR